MLKILPLICIVIVSSSEAGRRGREKRLSLAPEIKLYNDRGIPIVGLGTWQLGDDSQVEQAIKDAIDVGYRHIDTASRYDTEKGIGIALRQAITSRRVKREDMFITSKVWNNMHSRPKVIESINASLKNLGLKYLDLALIHWPTGFFEEKDPNFYPKYKNGSVIPRTWEKDDYLETWKGLEDAVNLGLTKYIGVSNFNIRQLGRVLDEAKIKPVINQVECHPYLNQQKLLEFCQKNNVLLEAYAPIRRADKELLNDPVLTEIAAKHNKTAAQVAFRWQIQRGVVVIPKTSKKSRMIENLDIFDFNISDEDMRKVLGMKQKERYYDIPGIQNHPDYPFNEE
jgi:aldehyde reductase